jgi:ArsR family transcriptional regulator
VSSESPKSRIFEQFAVVAKALGHVNRLELLEHLAQGEGSVEALAERSGLTVGNASQHLHQLRRAGLVITRKAGKHVFYRLTDDEVVTLIASLRRIAERNLGEIERLVTGYFRARDDMEPVSRQELTERIRAGLVTVLDVRPQQEFAAGHLPGAINMPLEEMARRLSELPPDKDVVAYCRGPYCVLAYEAVAALRQSGLKARRLDDGYPEWKAAGLPVEAEPAAD